MITDREHDPAANTAQSKEHVGKLVVFARPHDEWTCAAQGVVKNVEGDHWIVEFTAVRTIAVHKSNLEVA